MRSFSRLNRSVESASIPALGRVRPGFTLAELMVSMAMASLLMAGMMSAIFLAMRSADMQVATTNAIDGGLVLEEITSELRDAAYFKQRTATAVTFTVPDRDGDSIVETIRYSWSGTDGDPLLRNYNGASAVAVIEDVHDFSFSYNVQTNPIQGRILLVVPDEDNLDSNDAARKSQLESWGYTVMPITAKTPKAELAAMAAVVDAIYISENVLSGNLNTKLKDATVGILNEERALFGEFELASQDGGTYSETRIDVTDNTHYVTSPFNLGTLQITSTSQELFTINGTPAPDLQLLADQFSGAPAKPSIGVIGPGGGLDNGTAATGARLNLPFGGNSFSFLQLNSNGLTLLQRAVDWSARKYVVTSVGMTLQVGPDSLSTLQTSTEIVGRPRA